MLCDSIEGRALAPNKFSKAYKMNFDLMIISLLNNDHYKIIQNRFVF